MERIQRAEEAKEAKLSDLMNSIVPKLVNLALTKIAISMYQIPEIKNHEINSGKLYMRLDKEWEYRVRRKLNTLNMPPNLKTVVVQLIRPLSMEINHWMNDFRRNDFSNTRSVHCELLFLENKQYLILILQLLGK
ncbi:hypothetical protein CEXT_434221 [Caerostris extrusa]|uniref:Uncharacterized protein n=1 Tax=Caerostris extrusa TaxID=172846 RepID=A0AAV4Y4C4_CAEEX|nr:hypothetical protein CEXT_434221 [Caerostris extrusa]